MHIGFGNVVNPDKIVSILAYDSAPTKRVVRQAEDREMLLDATMGRRTRSVIVTDSNHVILSNAGPMTLAERCGLISKSNIPTFEEVQRENYEE